MTSSRGGQDRHESWLIDQVTKSEFFHQKLHEYGLLEIAYAIEEVQGEKLEWNREELGISEKAWNQVIHRGIKPVRVFAHPYVLRNVRRSVGYYQKLAMVSLKSMNNIGPTITGYEAGTTKRPMAGARARVVCRRLNELISRLIESDEVLDPREFDLWRGMTAGSTAQGSWQNLKGDRTEGVIRGIVTRRIQSRQLLIERSDDGRRLRLKDGRTVEYGSEPDLAIYGEGGDILAAVEIKGGIDAAGVLERIGAVIKSLSRYKQASPGCTTVLIVPGVSMTDQAEEELRSHRQDIDHWFTVEDVLNRDDVRLQVFELLGI